MMQENSLEAYTEQRYSLKAVLGHMQGSLYYAFLARYIFEGPTRNPRHMTAIDIMYRRNHSLDHGIFCSKIGKDVFLPYRNTAFYAFEHHLMPN